MEARSGAYTLTRRILASATLVLTGLLLWPITAKAQALADYTATHPFISTSIPPNILLLLDNSGSMNLAAYPFAFDPTKTYYGLFDPKNCYQYDGVANTFRPNPTPAPYPCPASYPWDGGLLNYVSHRRIDMAHYAMTGGHCLVVRDAQNGCSQIGGQTAFSWEDDEQQMIPKAQVTGRMPAALIPTTSSAVYFTMIGGAWWTTGIFCVGDDPSWPWGPTCNDPAPASGYMRTAWSISVTPLQPAMGVLQQVGSKARFGLMVFNDGIMPPGGKVLTPVGGNLATLINQIDAQAANTWTPSAESLYEAVRYFAQIPPAFASTDYTYTDPTLDPYYFAAPTWASTAQTVPCCQSFILFFTDGLPTWDTQVPTALQDYAHAAASHGTSDHCGGAAGCSSYYTAHANPSAPLHLSINEHHDNCSLYTGTVDWGGGFLYSDPCYWNGTHFLDDVAYYAHTTDLRQSTLPLLGAGKDLPGVQSLTIYTFLAFAGSVSGGGASILQAAAKVGAFTDLNGNNVPDLPQEWDVLINATGAAGSDGIPDTFFQSSDAAFLRSRLLAAITQMLQQSASGTSAAVVASSSSGEGVSYQAYFYPTLYDGYNQIKWTGYLQGLFVAQSSF